MARAARWRALRRRLRWQALWPRSLQGQMLLAIAVALLVAQGISAVLIWRAQYERHINGLVNAAAFRLMGDRMGPPPPLPGGPPPFARRRRGPPVDDGFRLPRPLRLMVSDRAPGQPGDTRRPEIEAQLREILDGQSVQHGALLVLERDPHRDAVIDEWMENVRRRFDRLGWWEGQPRLVIAAMQRGDGRWLAARIVVPPTERQVLATLFGQTVLLYLVLMAAVALIVRRITRPLRALTRRLGDFARERSATGQLAPEGPDDIRSLIAAHNAMEARIAALLDEKDVMLGAIGHDLKTPLAALRVRIEAVEDDAERGRMAATITDITRSLDDILSLARVGRPTDPVESTELSALVADVVGEFEDMGEDVALGAAARMVAPVRVTWLRRALRNLVSNALRYGQRARVSLERDGDAAVLRVEDDGPGIPPDAIARMMEPFTRLDASRNSGTGGTGLGLALARAIAEQHGGSLVLTNRGDPGAVRGLVATLRVPLEGGR